jgi:hypothetical protein
MDPAGIILIRGMNPAGIILIRDRIRPALIDRTMYVTNRLFLSTNILSGLSECKQAGQTPLYRL